MHLRQKLETIGFASNHEDMSTYTYSSDKGMAFLWVHVDDGVLMAKNDDLLHTLQSRLTDIITMKWDDRLSSIVGISVSHRNGAYSLSQPALIDKILLTNDSLLTSSTPLSDTSLTSNLLDKPDTDYLHRIGMLLYLAQGTRPDILFAVHYLARFSLNPDATHFLALTKLIRYIRLTQHFKLILRPTASSYPLQTYVDANWGGEGAWLSHGFLTTLWDALVNWGSKRQTCVARSTCQAEYMALSMGAMESLWLQNLLNRLLPGTCPAILSDNQAAVKIASDKASMKNSRHIDREFHYVNELLRLGRVEIRWIPGTAQYADVFTKALGNLKHRTFTDSFFSELV